MAVDAFTVAMRANSTGPLSSAALVSISEAVSTTSMLWSAFGTTLPRWAIAALLGCGLRVTLNNRHHVTFRFSTDSLPLFGTMSNVTFAPSRRSLSPAFSTAEM
jgi:hypothetical protein